MNTLTQLIFATDLDGTFLGGTDPEKIAFYQEVAQKRDRFLLIFVTGRSLESVQSLYTYPYFPKPDYIIGDVGTTVYDAKTGELVHSVQDWIEKAWNQGGDRVKSLLENAPGLELQSVRPKYRVSYYYNPQILQPSTLQKVIDAGFDCILSADEFLDIMPRGVAKGSTLLKLLETLQLNPENAILAGDTLNDLSLFQTGLKSIAVGNSEPQLLLKAKGMDNVYCSPYSGVVGIEDGWRYYGFVQ